MSASRQFSIPSPSFDGHAVSLDGRARVFGATRRNLDMAAGDAVEKLPQWRRFIGTELSIQHARDGGDVRTSKQHVSILSVRNSAITATGCFVVDCTVTYRAIDSRVSRRRTLARMLHLRRMKHKRIDGFNLTAGSCVYHDSHCDIQPWARAAHPYCSA